MYQFKSAAGGLLPVMVFVYGGSFSSGDNKAANYGPHYFLDKDVVLVTVNYRLSVLGEYNRNELNKIQITLKRGGDISLNFFYL